MPINYSKYPPNWKSEIRPRILKRAENRCEYCGAENYKPHPVTGSKVVLTIAHLDHDPENWDVKDERLAALCQKCHLAYDRKERGK
jgi:5-methylcytosine-specific restriction endonuclease McrA